METVVGIIVGLIILVLLVAVHELGHGIVARRNGVDVEEFGIGFPPLAWGKKIAQSFLGKNVLYSVNWLPLGGFVRLKGEFDDSKGKGHYGSATYWVKTKILFAGVVMNWIVAVLLFTILAWTGLPQIVDGQFSVASDTRTEVTQASKLVAASVVDGSPAADAGFKSGDELKEIDSKSINSAQDFVNFTKQHKGEKVEITYARDGKTSTKTVQLQRDNSNKKGYLGLAVGETAARKVNYATWSAPIVGVGTTAQLTWKTYEGLGTMVGNLATGLVNKLSSDQTVRQQGADKLSSVSESVAGPVGILGVIFPEAEKSGPTTLVFLTAIISLSLAAMNVLPIPALDGGRWFTMTVFRLRKKTLTKEIEENIQATGMLVLLGLIVLITIADIGKVLR